MKKRLLKSMLAITGLLASTNVVAADYNYDFKVGDIYYNITSKENRTVEVTNSYGGKTACNYSSDYTGDILFPESVVYNDTTYAVKAIGEFAMCNSYEVNSIVIPASIDSIKAQALRLIFEVDANGKVIANTYKTLPKVIIEYGNSILHYGTSSISADSVLINREMKFHKFVEWGNYLTQKATYIEFGDSVSVIPSALTYNNTSLKEVKFPNRPFSFDIYNPDFNYLRDGIFSGCTSLEKVDLSNLVPARSYYEWVDYDDGGGYYNELANITNAYFIPPMTFKGCTALKEVILPDTVAYLNGVNIVSGVKNHFVGSSAFEGCTALESFKFPGVTFDKTATSRIGHRIGNRAFACSGLKSLELPSFISCLDSEAFADCASLESVTMPTVLDWYKLSYENRGNYESSHYQNSYGVYNYYLSKNLFANCTALKTVDFGCIKVVIPNTFAGCNIENINLGGVTYLGEGNFASSNLKTFSISSDNTEYKIEDNILKTYDGKQWLLTTSKNYTGATVLKNDIVEVISPQLFEGLPIESYDLPNVYSIGDRAFANTNLKNAEIKANIKVYNEEYMETIEYSMSYGAEAFADCKKLEEYSIDADVTKLPKGIFKNCELLTESAKILETKIIPADIFYGTGITEFTFGEKVEVINESAMPNGTTDITIYASNPPVVIESDEAEYISNVTLVVPSSCVDVYSAHKFWGRAKEVVANSDYEGHGWSGYIEPAPNGLYFAKKDGNICYFDGENVIDTYIPAGSHTFQLASWHGAIYGVNAGEQYYYVNDENNTLGDGELYVVNKREQGFSKSTIVNNKNYGDGKNYHAFNDPFHIMIDNDKIYYTNRNFIGIYDIISGVRVLPAKEVYNTPYMTSNEVPIFATADKLPYYGRQLAYGAIHAGLQRDSEGVYWHALNYNGNCIIRYKQSHIYASVKEAQSASIPYPVIAQGIKLSAMFLDEKNDYIYIFSTLSGYHGVYRARISAVKNGGYELFATSAKKWELIDSSPASAENTTNDEGVYVRQFTSDGNYVYWAYIAEKGSGYKSGIKRVNATGTPKVEYVVEDVEAYGICHYEYDGSRSPSVETKEQTATFAIPRVDNATEYTLNVYYDAEKTQLAKTVHYDETGKIIPMSDYIELTIDGFENGNYYYDVVAKSESGDVLNSYTGSFEIEYTGVENISINNNAVEVARYDIYGRKLNEATTGVNIVKYSDGTTRKECVKK